MLTTCASATFALNIVLLGAYTAGYQNNMVIVLLLLMLAASLGTTIASYSNVKAANDDDEQHSLSEEENFTLVGMCVAFGMVAAFIFGVVTSKTDVKSREQPLAAQVFALLTMLSMLTGCIIEGIAAYRLR